MNTQKTFTKTVITLIVAIGFGLFSIFWIIGPSPNTSNQTKAPGSVKNPSQDTSKNPKAPDDNFFKTDDSSKFTTVYIDEKTPNFTSKPYLEKNISTNTLMVPAKEFLDFIGVQTNQYSNGKVIVGFKKNVTVKITADSQYAYLNGNKRQLIFKSTSKNGVIYCPLDFLSSAYDYILKEKSNKFYAKSREHLEVFTQFEDIYYKSTPVPNLDATVSVPEYWKSLGSSGYSYGYIEGDEYVTSSIYSYPDSSTSINKVAEKFISSNLNKKFNVLSKSQIKVSDYDGMKIVATLKSDGNLAKKPHYVYYLAKNKSSVYALAFYTNNKLGLSFYTKAFDNVVSTFRINSLNIDYLSEFYVEHDNFFSQGFSITSPNFAGKLSYGAESLKGSFSYIPSGKKLVAVVRKRNSKTWFAMNTSGNTIDSKIYLPYGLGKHNVTISEVDKSAYGDDVFPQALKKSNMVMEFTVINTDSTLATYLIPSYFVDWDNRQIINVGNLRTYSEIKQIDKARSLFKYTASNLKLEVSSLMSPASVTLKNKFGTEKEVNALYTALLRSIGIPARISTCKVGKNTKYVTEMEINGNWIIADPANGIRDYIKGDPDIFSDNFSLTFSDFYEGKESIKRLNY